MEPRCSVLSAKPQGRYISLCLVSANEFNEPDLRLIAELVDSDEK